MRADEAAGLVPKDGWQRLSCADGSKSPRLYDWRSSARQPGTSPARAPSLAPGEKGQPGLAFFRCWSPRPVTLPELTAVAGARWGVEDCFAEAKGEAGLDHYQVRKYRAWYRTPPCPCSPMPSSLSPPGLTSRHLARCQQERPR